MATDYFATANGGTASGDWTTPGLAIDLDDATFATFSTGIGVCTALGDAYTPIQNAITAAMFIRYIRVKFTIPCFGTNSKVDMYRVGAGAGNPHIITTIVGTSMDFQVDTLAGGWNPATLGTQWAVQLLLGGNSPTVTQAKLFSYQGFQTAAGCGPGDPGYVAPTAGAIPLRARGIGDAPSFGGALGNAPRSGGARGSY